MSHIDQRRHEISRSHQSPEYWFTQNHRKNCYCFLYQLIGEDRLDTNSWHTEALHSKENLWHKWDSNPHTPHTSLVLIPLRHKTPRLILRILKNKKYSVKKYAKEIKGFAL